MSAPTLDLALPGDRELRSTVVGAGGIDPWAEQARIADARPADIAGLATVFAGSGSQMDQAYRDSGAAQARLGDAFTNDNAAVLDRDGFFANLPAGFRDSGAQLAASSRSLAGVATDLTTALEQAGVTLRGLADDLAGRRQAWQAKVAAAGLIPPAQAGGWLADRDTVAAGMASAVAVAGAAVGAAITEYERSLNAAIRVFADQGHVPPDQVAGLAAPGAEYAGAVDPATLGTPAGAGAAADPVNTGTGNFVEVETDLGFSGLVAGLTWTRVYNSRSPGGGPLGPRWSSWASTRLEERGGGVRLRGPDGGALFFPRDGDGFGSIGAPARVERGATGLVVCWPDGRRWMFDDAGRPALISTGPGTDVAFVRDDGGRLVSLVHAGGRTVELAWADGRIVAVSSGDRRIAYDYDRGHLVKAGGRRYGIGVDGLLATVTDADGVVELVNTYDGAGRVVEQLTPFGRTVRFAYEPGGVTVTDDDTGGPRNTFLHDDRGRLVGSIDGHGATTALRRDVHGRIVTITDRAGAVTSQEWDERGRLVRRVPPSGIGESFHYDESDRVVAVRVAGPARDTAYTVFSYTGAERVPSRIEDPEGGVTRLEVTAGSIMSVTDPDGVTVTFSHDDDGAVVSATDASGATGYLERDDAGRAIAAISPSGRRTGFGYDTNGWLASRTDPDGAVWRFEHTVAGRLAAVIDPVGARTQYRYGAHGERSEVVDPLGVVTGLAHDPSGNLAAVTAGDGAKWTYRHDALSRLAAWTDPAGGTWLREYDPEGRLTASIDPAGVRAIATHDPAGRVVGLHDGSTSSEFGYDELGRAVSHTRPDGAALTVSFDRCGRVVTSTDPEGGVSRHYYTAAGRLRRTVSPAGRVTAVEHDACGRVAARVDPAGGRWTYRHDVDGRVVAATSAAGLVETFTHDPCGRLRTRTTPGLGVTTFDHDLAGRLIGVTDRAGTRRFTRDLAGRVVAAVDALGHVTGYTYDTAGRVTTTTDPTGAVWSRSYDANGRVATETDPLGHVTGYTYDGAGRLLERIDATGAVVRYHHDLSGRISRIGGDVDITIERDLLGRPVGITEPGIPDIGLGYDRSGRLTERRSGDRVLRWAYDPDGLPVGRMHPDGHTVTTDRDPAGHTVAITHPLLGRVEVDRDPDGRLLDLRATGVHRMWTYRDGLISAYQTGTSVTRLDRDQHGRVSTVSTDATPRQLGYDPGGQLTSAGDWTFRYDPCGRLVEETGPGGHQREFTYDPAGRVTRAGNETFTSDPAGRRITRSGPRGTLHHTYDALDRPTRIGDSALTVDALGELIQAGDTPVAWDTADPMAPLAQLGDRTLIGDAHPWAATHPEQWLHPDWQHSIGGSPTGDPWGGAGPDPAPGYRGELALQGHIWLRNRTYDPTTRAFTTPDPWPAVPGTAYAGNPYHYAGNDPINQIDPLGLRPLTDTDINAQKGDAGILGGIGNWWDNNWEYVAGGAMIAAGAALMFTGVGGPAGIALMAGSGALFAAGASTLAQKSATGTVNWGQVGAEAAIGGATGGAAGIAGAAAMHAGELFIGARSVETLGATTAPEMLNPGGAATDLLTSGKAAAPGSSLGTTTGAVRASMVADASGTIIPTSRSVLEQGFKDAGFPTSATRSPGMGYILPDGSIVRIMDAQGQAPIRASFTNASGGHISPFTGKPVHPPPGVTGSEWTALQRELTHLELNP